MDPFWGLFLLKKNRKRVHFWTPKGVAFFYIFLRLLMHFLRGFPFAFRYGCCILTCLLIETGAWLVLVARQSSVTIQRPRAGTALYCRWPSGLRLTASRGSTPPWSKARVVTWGTQTKAQYNVATRGHAPNGARAKRLPKSLQTWFVKQDPKPVPTQHTPFSPNLKLWSRSSKYILIVIIPVSNAENKLDGSIKIRFSTTATSFLATTMDG